MSYDTKLSTALQSILHIEKSTGPVTSENIAFSIRTNPVLVQRLLGHLRRAGILVASKGHGGGWLVAEGIADVTFRQLYEAIGSPKVLGMTNRESNLNCPIEKKVNRVIGQKLRETENGFLKSLEEIKIGALLEDRRTPTKTATLTGAEENEGLVKTQGVGAGHVH